MKKLLNTLYVTSPQAYLARDGENIVIRDEEEEVFRIPAHNLEGLVSFGYRGASPGLMELCVHRGIALSFVSENGRFLARVTGPVRGNVLLRRQQYRMADGLQESLGIAQSFIFAKITNARHVLQRALRDHKETMDYAGVTEEAVCNMGRQLQNLGRSMTLEELRGAEGEAARTYFNVFPGLIREDNLRSTFNGRNRYPPKDPVNAMLSFAYTLLMHDVQGALETVGLDPAVGFLHRDRAGRPSLALDLMEELRPYLADRLVLSLINRQQITQNDFKESQPDGVWMKDKARNTFIDAWQQRKREKIRHPYLGETVRIGLLPHIQALLLARFIRGDIDGYPAFLCR